jgi:tetratricopeptide (TPR) repeat protein
VVLSVAFKVKYSIDTNQVQGASMKDIDYALMLIKAKKLDGAKDILEELLKSDPQDKDILYNLGMCYTELGEPDMAVKTLSECVRFYPNYSNAYVALGFAHSMLSNYEKAKEYFLKALEIDPVNSYALRNLGGIYGNENDYEKAFDCFEKSFSINQEDQQTAYGLGYTYFHTGKLDKADEYFKIVIALDESTKIANLAKDLRREIAEINLKSKGFRMDAMFYCLSALQFFKGKPNTEVNKVAFEIGLKGQQGLDINNPTKKYTLNTMKGSFTGLQLVSYMYVGFKIIDHSLDIGLDLSEEYKEALRLFEQERPHGYTIH